MVNKTLQVVNSSFMSKCYILDQSGKLIENKFLLWLLEKMDGPKWKDTSAAYVPYTHLWPVVVAFFTWNGKSTAGDYEKG